MDRRRAASRNSRTIEWAIGRSTAGHERMGGVLAKVTRRTSTLRTPGAWRAAVIGLALLAFAVRLLIIAHSRGGSDLRIYTYFSRLALHGINPYASLHGGQFPPEYGNDPPVEVAAFAGLLAIHDSATTLRVLFAAADVTVLLLIGFCFPRSRGWRAGFLLFYAFNPFVLISWTAFAEDKTILFFGIAAWVLALERSRRWLSWVAASALTVFKFLGAFAVPILALQDFRASRWRAVAPIACFLAILIAGNLPWFPKSLDAFARRDARLAINPPIHASPTIVLSRLGIYTPLEAKLLTIAAIVAVLVCFAARRIDVREGVVWSLFVGYVFLPDDPFNRILLITLPFMLLIDFSAVRWFAVWAFGGVAALAEAVATRGVPHALSFAGGPLRAVFGRESTVRHVVWMNALLALVLAFYFADRRKRLLPQPDLVS